MKELITKVWMEVRETGSSSTRSDTIPRSKRTRKVRER